MRLARIGRVPRRLVPQLLRPLGVLERASLSRVDDRAAIAPPPLFIVGAPRTGSTLLYQVITNTFRVGYISNLVAHFSHALTYGLRLHRRRFGDRPHDSFRSTHGRTSGLAAPSETGKFWYRFFPRDRDFVEAGEVSAERRRLLRRTVAAGTRALGRPLVFKNLNNGQRLQVLAEVFPEALIVWVRRDPLATARSLAVARRREHGDLRPWFSVRPREHAVLAALPWPEQVVRQVHALEAQIAADLERFPPRQRLVLDYAELRNDPAGTLSRVESLYAGIGERLGRREGAAAPQIGGGGEDGLSEAEQAALAAAYLDVYGDAVTR